MQVDKMKSHLESSLKWWVFVFSEDATIPLESRQIVFKKLNNILLI